ncbi:retention module-containing protein, partial [Pseudoteredinibacter isoporae]
MVDLSIGVSAQNLSSAGVVVAIQGAVDNLTNGESLQLGVPIHLGDSLHTSDNASVVVRFLTGGALALGANQSVLIDESLIERLKQQGSQTPDQEESIDFASLIEAIERGESIEELLPPTAAGDDGGAGGSALAGGVRFEYTGGQVLPVTGFDSSSASQFDSNAATSIDNSTDDLGIPAPGALGFITVVQDINGDGFINVTENDGQVTVTIELPDNLFPGSTVVVNGVEADITQADIDAGSISVNLPLPADGETIDIIATPFNPAGTAGDSVSTTITIDISEPLLTIDPLPPGNDTAPTISGTGEPGNVVTVTDPDGNVIGTTTVDPEGGWQVTPANPIEEPGTQITVTTEDPAGNSTTLVEDIVIDTTAPGGGTEKPTVSIPEAQDGVNKEEFDDGIQVQVGLPSGTEPGDEIIVTVTTPDGETTEMTFPVNPDGAGNQEITIPVNALPSPPDGNYTIEVTVVDPVGNESLPSDPVSISVDTTAPGEIAPGVPGDIPAPIVTIPEAVDSVDEQELADGVQVQVVLPTGTEPGDTVTVSVSLPDGSTETIDYAVSPNDGASVEITVPTNILPEPPDGDYQVTVVVTDQSGNVGESSDTVPFTVDTVDLTAPPSPQISFVEDTNKDGYVNFEESSANTDGEVDVVITLASGTPLGSTLLVIIDGNEASIPVTAVILSQGQTTITVPQPDDGSELTVSARVTAPNGVDSPEVEGSLLIDVTDFKGASPALSVELLTDANDDGSITSSELLSSNQTGTVEVLINLPEGSRAGDKLIISATGQSPREIIVSDADISAGRVEIAVDALDHGQTLEVTAQIFDAAGNQSDEVRDSATMDLQPMGAPLVVFVDDSSGNGEVNNDEVAGKTELTVDIILPSDVEPGDKVIVDVNGVETEVPLTQQMVDDKKITVMVPTPDDGETVTVKAKVEDAAGEQGPEGENEVTAKTPDLNTGLSVSVVEDSDDDGVLTQAELGGASIITADVQLPPDASEGDTLVLEVNGNPRTITLTNNDIQNGSVAVEVPAPAPNQTVEFSAEIHDDAGNSSDPVSDSVNMESVTVAGAPSIKFIDDSDGDGYLNEDEANGLSDLSVEFTLPSGLSAGDELVHQVDGGTEVRTTLTQADIDAGLVSVSIPVPQDGQTLEVAAYVEQSGVAGPSTEASISVDTSDLSNGLDVTIVEDSNNDGRLSASEAQGSLSVRVELPADAEAGDTLVLNDNNGAPRVVTVSDAQIAAGEVLVDYPMPAEGTLFEVTAKLNDAAGNTSLEVNDSVEVDTNGLSAPQIRIVDDNAPDDGVLNDAELSGKSDITVEVTLPIGVEVGDTLVYQVDGGPEQSQVITQDQIDAGLVEVSLPVPPDGSTLELEASVTDSAGNPGEKSNLEVTTDTSDLNTNLSLTILEDTNNNGVISIQEQNGAIDVRVNLPLGAQAGDSLRVEAAANTPTLVTLTAEHIADGYVDLALNSVSQGNDFVVSASVSDAAGNVSDPVTATALVEGQTQAKPSIRIVEDADGDGKITLNEIQGQVDVEVTLPATVRVGDSVVLKASNGEEFSEVVSQADLDRGSITFEVSPVADGETLSLESYIEDANGSAGESANESVEFATSASAAPVVTGIVDDVEPVAGTLQSGETSNDSRPVLEGLGESGDTINVFQDGNLIGKTTVQPNGTWQFEVPELSDGDFVFTASSTDQNGNESSQTAPFEFTLDTRTPSVIENFVGTDDVGRVTGPIANGSTIDDAAPTFSGEVQASEQTAGSTVTLIVRDENDNIVQTIEDIPLTQGANPGDPATWEATPEPALANGNYKVSAEVVDPAGNTSSETAPIEFTVDTTTPGAPSIVRVIDNEPTGEEEISHQGITNDTTPTVEGTGPNNAKVTLYSADPSGLTDAEKAAITLGSFDTGSDGNWSITPSALPDGNHTFYADAEAANGEISPATGPYSIEIDSSIPTPPDVGAPGVLIAEDDQGAVTGPINNGDTTDDSNPRLHGQVSEPNGQVTIIIDGGTPNETTATVDADDQGNWEYTPSLGDGEHTVQIAVTDEAGNGPSAPSDPLTFTVDTSGVTVSIDKAVDDVPTPGAPANSTEDISDGGLTNDNMPMIVGSAKVGAEVTLEVNGQTYGPVTADGNGQWQIQITDALPEGQVTFTATAQDATGNDVIDTFVLDVDTTASAEPIINNAQDNVGEVQGVLNDGDSTDDNVPQLNGTGTPGETIRIHQDGNVVDEVTVQPDGSWTYTPTTALPEGEYEFTATTVDEAGNESNPSDGFTVIVDRTAPEPIENFVGTDDVGRVTGPIANGSTIDDAAPTFSGEVQASEADAGSTITLIVRDENDNIVQTIEDIPLTQGVNPGDPATWEATPEPALTNGGYKVSAEIVDPAGNTSSETSPIEFTVDTTTPGAPSIVRVIDNEPTGEEEISHLGITNDTTPTVEGTGPNNAKVTLYSADPSGLTDAEKTAITLGTFDTGSDGNWSITPSALPDGDYTFYADAEAANGEISPSTGPYSITVDSSVPTPPDVGTPGVLIAEDDQGAVTGPINNGDTTDDSNPRLHGQVSEPNGQVTIIIDEGTPNETTATVDADDQGNWEYTPSLGDGEHTVQIAVTDEAGNGPSAPSDPLTFTVDTSGVTVSIDKAVDDVPAPGEPANSTSDISDGGLT